MDENGCTHINDRWSSFWDKNWSSPHRCYLFQISIQLRLGLPSNLFQVSTEILCAFLSHVCYKSLPIASSLIWYATRNTYPESPLYGFPSCSNYFLSVRFKYSALHWCLLRLQTDELVVFVWRIVTTALTCFQEGPSLVSKAITRHITKSEKRTVSVMRSMQVQMTDIL
jgi:hypothetical protein